MYDAYTYIILQVYYKILYAPHISHFKTRKFPSRNLLHDKFMVNFLKNFNIFLYVRNNNILYK